VNSLVIAFNGCIKVVIKKYLSILIELDFSSLFGFDVLTRGSLAKRRRYKIAMDVRPRANP